MAGSSSGSSVPPKSKFILTTYFFSKSLMIILALLVFSFFPSQAPEIFKETTIVTKLWDLIYLLVIGIAVCYGLFSRKTDASSIHTSDDGDDKIGEKEETYLSGISHISSIFENEIQNSYVFEENYSAEKFKGLGSRFSEIGESDGKKLNQYFLGESMVVINDENYVIEQLGGQKTSKQNKPLCLPVRNLGSKSLDSVAAGKSVVGDPSSGWDVNQTGKFKGLVPIKLEQKFKEETDSDSDSDSRTRLNWRSKSMRLGKRDHMFAAEANETSHVRPLDFDGLKSQPSKIKNLPEKEKLNNSSEKEEILKDFGKNEVDDGKTYDSKHNSMFVKSKSQSSSTGASSERNLETLKSMLLTREEEKADIPNSNLKPPTIANTYKKGKSVRTNRSKEQAVETKVKMFQSQTGGDKVETRSKLGINETNAEADEMSDAEPHSGEVDRKAEEFIAKFREQIRLQKVASARKLNLL